MKPSLPPKATRDIDQIASSRWNQLLDCLAWAMEHPRADGRTIRQHDGILGVIPGQTGFPRRDRWLVRVYNNTPDNLDTFDAVFLGETYRTPPAGSDWTPEAANLLEFTLRNPAQVAVHDAPVAILTQSVASGAHGLAVVSGLALATVNILHAGHGFARWNGTRYRDYAASKWRYLASDTYGHRILWSPGTTGFQPCVLSLGSVGDVRRCGWFEVGEDTVTVRFADSVGIAAQIDYTFAVPQPGETGVDQTIHFFHSNHGGPDLMYWYLSAEGSALAVTPSGAPTASRKSYFALATTKRGPDARLICSLLVGRDSAGSIFATWTLPPPESVPAIPPPRLYYSGGILHWEGAVGLGSGTSLTVPAGTDASFYAAGQWGGAVQLVFSGTGYDWGTILGSIQTDASGNLLNLVHDNPAREAMFRYVYTGSNPVIP